MITSTTNQHIKELHKLKQKKTRKEQGLFLIEGYHLVEEAKRANCLVEVLSTEEYDFENVTLVKEHIIEKLSSSKNPQPIIGVCKFVESNVVPNKLIYLDVSDPVNLGTLIRSAVGFGFGILLSPNSVDEYNSKVLRGTQGALFNAYIERIELGVALEKYEYTVFAADMNGSTSFEVPEKVLLVMGNESAGIDSFSKENLTLIKVETEVIESLNLSVAGSILMHLLK